MLIARYKIIGFKKHMVYKIPPSKGGQVGGGW